MIQKKKDELIMRKVHESFLYIHTLLLQNAQQQLKQLNNVFKISEFF